MSWEASEDGFGFLNVAQIVQFVSQIAEMRGGGGEEGGEGGGEGRGRDRENQREIETDTISVVTFKEDRS